MATDAEAAGGESPDQPEEESGEPTPFFVEIWNDYDPSMRFAAIFPVGEEFGAVSSTVAYYIIEPGKHTGLHSDSAEEVVFVAEGQGEVFMIGRTQRLEAGKFMVFPPGMDHDIYSQGSTELRLLSFFPEPEVFSTFQQVIFPMGGNVLSSKPPKGPVVEELDPDNLPADFPFDLADLGMAERGADEPRELTMTERLIGMTEAGQMPPHIGEGNVIDPQTATGPIQINPDPDEAAEGQDMTTEAEGDEE